MVGLALHMDSEGFHKQEVAYKDCFGVGVGRLLLVELDREEVAYLEEEAACLEGASCLEWPLLEVQSNLGYLEGAVGSCTEDP